MTMLSNIILASALVCSVYSLQQPTPSRRAFLGGAAASALVLAPSIANAGIDVSSLSVEGGGNNMMRDQLKAYDGSGASRVQEIKASSPVPRTVVAASPTLAQTPPEVATFAMRYGDFTRITKKGLNLNRLDDYVVCGADNNNNGKVVVSFEFPADWLQLDRMSGGIQYVDQRNGDKVYLLKATLPEGETLESTPKKFFGDSVFDQRGAIAKSGNTIDEYKVGRSELLLPTRRRFTMKYSTVTGNGLRVERRALVDAQQILGTNDVYMCMTSSNANKFEAKGRERETVEAIVDSFRCDKA